MGIYNSFPLLVADSHGFQKGDFWALTPHNMKHYPSHLGPKHKAFSASVYGGIFPPPLLRTFFSCAVFMGPSHTLPLCLSLWVIVTAFDCALNHLPPTDDTFSAHHSPFPQSQLRVFLLHFHPLSFPLLHLGSWRVSWGRWGPRDK